MRRMASQNVFKRNSSLHLTSNTPNVPTGSSNAPKYGKDFKKNSLQIALVQLYESGCHTNVNIQVRWRGEVTEFKTHRLLLAVRSPVFAKEFLDKEGFSMITFVVEGISPQVMKILLWFIYTDELIAETPKQIVGFAKVARYYQLGGINLLCKQALLSYFPDELNVWGLLDAALFFKMEPLRKTCIQVIQSNLQQSIKSPEFPRISQETLTLFVKQLSQSLSRHETLNYVLRWLQHNKHGNRSVLAHYGIESLSIDEFLDLLDSFPSFLAAKDSLSILINKLRPGAIELPQWLDENIKATPSKDVPVEISAAIIADSSLRLETSCSQRLVNCALLGNRGFKCSLTFQLKPFSKLFKPLNVMMLELVFGSSFVPEDNLDIKFFTYHHTFKSIKKKKLNISLYSTPDNYYIILKENCKLDKILPFVFTLQVEAKNLKRWRKNGPLPNDQYRVLQMPEKKVYMLPLYDAEERDEAVILTSLSDWLAFVDPKRGTKSFAFTALYFNTES